MTGRKTAYNSTYKKLAAQWLNEALCFVSSSVLADSLVLENPAFAKRQTVSSNCRKPMPKEKDDLKNINLQHIEMKNGQSLYGHNSANKTISD